MWQEKHSHRDLLLPHLVQLCLLWLEQSPAVAGRTGKSTAIPQGDVLQMKSTRSYRAPGWVQELPTAPVQVRRGGGWPVATHSRVALVPIKTSVSWGWITKLGLAKTERETKPNTANNSQEELFILHCDFKIIVLFKMF